MATKENLSNFQVSANLRKYSSSCTHVPIGNNGLHYLIRRDDSGRITGVEKIGNMKEKPFVIDFTTKSFQQRLKLAHSELVVRALGKAGLVLDLTAGLGRDSMMLAGAGKRVIMIEEQAVLGELLDAALQKLSTISDYQDLCERVRLIRGSSFDAANSIRRLIMETTTSLVPPPISVYLDPMYPERPETRKSLVKKGSQWLHLLARRFPHEEEEANHNARLFEVAKEFSTDRIVVKRSASSPYLVKNLKPHAMVSGKSQRFDIYFVNQL